MTPKRATARSPAASVRSPAASVRSPATSARSTTASTRSTTTNARQKRGSAVVATAKDSTASVPEPPLPPVVEEHATFQHAAAFQVLWWALFAGVFAFLCVFQYGNLPNWPTLLPPQPPPPPNCLPIYYDTLRAQDLPALARTLPQLLKRSAGAELCLYATVDDLALTGPLLESLLKLMRLRAYTILKTEDYAMAAPAASTTVVEILQRLRQLKGVVLRSVLVLSPDLLLFGNVTRIWQHEACQRVRSGEAEVASVQDEDAGVLCVNLATPRQGYVALPGHFNCHGLASAQHQATCVEDDGTALRRETARCMGMRWNGGLARPWLDLQVVEACSFHRHYWPAGASA